MNTRQLGLADQSVVMDLIRNADSGGFDTNEARYASILDEWYLRGPNHKMIGTFDGEQLIAICGMRLDIPVPYTWALTNLKTRGDRSIRVNGLKETMTMVYEEAERLGFTQ